MATDSIRRVACYVRVSTEEQRERQTIQNQLDRLHAELARSPDGALVGIYEDNGVSGSIPLRSRPGGGMLLADAERGLFDEVWVVRADRLGRDAEDMLHIWKRFKRLAIRLVGVEQSIESFLTFGLQALVAEDEKERILARSAAGMNRAARDGRYCGGIVPLGYMIEGKRPDARLVPSDNLMWADLTEADVVRKIYHLLAVEGWSCRKIAQEFNTLGIPTAHQKAGRGIRNQRTQGIWRPGRIRNLVVNPVYRGELQYGRRTTRPGGRDVISARVPRLVTDDVWYAAQEALARNRIMAKNTKRKHLLRSVIRCGVCGLTYCGAFFGRASWYRCNGQLVERGPIEGRCPGKSIRCDFIEPIVWSDIERLLREPGELLAELEAETNDEAGGAVAEAERVTLATALHDLNLQRQRVHDLHIRGRMTDREADDHLNRIAADRAEIEKRIEALKPEEVERAPVAPPDLLECLNQRLDEGLSDEERQEIVRLLVSRIVIDTEILDGRKKRAMAKIEYRFPRVASTCAGTGSLPTSA